MYLVVFGRLFFQFLSIARQSLCLLLLITCRVVRSLFRLSGGAIRCDLRHRRRVAALSLFYRFRGSAVHSVGKLFPQLFTAGLPTHHNIAMQSFSLECPRCRISQYSRTFIPPCVSLWNILNESDITGDGLGAFKISVNRTLRVWFT